MLGFVTKLERSEENMHCRVGFCLLLTLANACASNPQRTSDIGLPSDFHYKAAQEKTAEVRLQAVKECRIFNTCRENNDLTLDYVCIDSDPCRVEQVSCQEQLNRVAITTAREYAECRMFKKLPTLTELANVDNGPCGTEYFAMQEAWITYQKSLPPKERYQHFGLLGTGY